MTLAHPAYGKLRAVTPTAAVLLANNPGPMTLDGTNTWILRAPGHTDCVVVDPGPDDSTHIAAIAAATGGAVALTLITHRHPDHTGGIDELVRLTGSPVRAMEAEFLRGDVAPLTDGEVIEIAGLRITVLHTPGHTADSVSFLLADAVLSGDTVLGRGTTVLDRDGTLRDYLRSMDRLLEEGAGRALLPAHGPDHPDLEPVARYYIAHRHERLEQVRSALDELGADADAMDVVRKVYVDVDESMWPMARNSVESQLTYLRSEADA
ncbi:MBL fold metallo-hydrolase [Nocardia carnea]|uniref:MBL fold metallo-hydrolase n=1 Tax=Nocardia carnea TaxID=37328 RepID=A0ABW7TXY4_9NOCA|nr:MBL fold metallo-hydrolase [Nocardia carnea]